ncbi:MAG: hypothetical protein AB7F88_06665 [Pyrinomonadaceae bacterium]
MIQFRNFPIYIVYSRNKQLSTFEVAYDYLQKGDDKSYEYVAVKGMSRLEITDDDPIHKNEIRKYENTIKVYLDKVAASPVGRCILDHLNLAEKIYIIPDPYLKTTAKTEWSKTRNEGNGLRIRVNPEDWVGYLDDLLAHELTHAIRFSNNRISKEMLLQAGHFAGDPLEEFLSTQVTNLYRSSIGKKQLYASYSYGPNRKPILKDKGTIYGEFVQYPELIMAIKYCRDNEPLATRLSKTLPNQPEFNPFRDAKVLERMAINKLGGGMTEFMPL